MPLEALGTAVALVEIVEHHLFQMAHSGVVVLPDAPLGHLREQPFYQIEPAPAGGREVHMITRIMCQSSLHFADLVSPIIVHHQMNVEAFRQAGFDPSSS